MFPGMQGFKDERGTALVLVMAFLGAVTVLLGSLLAGVNASLARRHADWRDQTLRALATAGVHYGAAQIAERGAGYAGDEKIAIGDGFASIAVLATSSAQTYEIRSTGTLHNDERIERGSERVALVRVNGSRIESIRHIDPGSAADSMRKGPS